MKLHIFRANNSFGFTYEKQDTSILEIEVTEAQKKILEAETTTLVKVDEILQDISRQQWWIKINNTKDEKRVHKTK